MGAVSFTVRRSALPHHTIGQVVVFEVDFEDAVRRRDVQRFVHRASDGKMQSLYERGDTLWEVLLAPAKDFALAQIREFLDSTASGEAFQIWLYGTEAAPRTARRIDSGYAPQPFQRGARASDDHFTHRITVIEQ